MCFLLSVTAVVVVVVVVVRVYVIMFICPQVDRVYIDAGSNTGSSYSLFLSPVALRNPSCFPFISQSSQYNICLDFLGIRFLSIRPHATFSGNVSRCRTVRQPFHRASLCKAPHGSKIRLSVRDTRRYVELTAWHICRRFSLQGRRLLRSAAELSRQDISCPTYTQHLWRQGFRCCGTIYHLSCDRTATDNSNDN